MIGKKFKNYREARGYTQEDFARRIGVARSTLAQYEAGCNNLQPSIKVIKKAAQVMNCTIDELLS